MLSSSGARSANRSPVPPPVPSLWALEELEPHGAHTTAFGDAAPTPALDADTIARDAYERGFENGRRAGEAAEATRMQPAIAAINDALLTLQLEADDWVANAQENVAALAIAVARQILAREVQGDVAMIEGLVRQALAEFPLDQSLIVRLNPADLAIVTSLKAGMAEGRPAPIGGDRPEVQWLADVRVTRGGCVIEGRDRIIDGRIDTALERLYRRITLTDA